MRRSRSVAVHVFLASLAGLAAAALAQEGAPARASTREILDGVESQSAQKCADMREQSKLAASPRQRFASSAGMEMHCDCLPAEIAALKAKPDLPRESTKDEAMALVKAGIEHCTAQSMRKFLVSGCPAIPTKEGGIKDQAAYCACLSRHVGALSDAEIATEAQEAHKDAEARAQALKEGKPMPPKRVGVMREADNACRAEQGAPPKP